MKPADPRKCDDRADLSGFDRPPFRRVLHKIPARPQVRKAHNLDTSMSRRVNCWDNAVAEPFFSGLKKVRIRRKIYRTRSLARVDIFDYAEMFYNRT